MPILATQTLARPPQQQEMQKRRPMSKGIAFLLSRRNQETIMGNQVEIICKNNGKTLLVDEGTALIDIYKKAGVELP